MCCLLRRLRAALHWFRERGSSMRERLWAVVLSTCATAAACGGAAESEDEPIGEVSLRAGLPAPLPPVSGIEATNSLIVNQQAAVRLGKALFWDVQLGGDGQIACATCHFHAG